MLDRHALLCLLALAAGACSDPSDDASDATAARSGGADASRTAPAKGPDGASAALEEVFHRAKDAFNHRDFRSLYGLMTDESRSEMLSSVFLGATAVVAASPNPDLKTQLERITEEHGVEEVDLERADGRNPMDVFGEVLENVQDPAGLLHDLLGFLDQFKQAGDRRMVALQNVVETGDRAGGTIVYAAATGAQQLETAEFRKVDGQWRLHLAQRKR